MILAISYADERFYKTQRFNSKRALKFGADKVKEYTREDIDEKFYAENKAILDAPRGGGYWLWKPYIIFDALRELNEGDYLVYTDAGSAFVNKIDYLLKAMEQEKTDIMAFCNNQKERCYSKRDAFVLMDCDDAYYYDSLQNCGGYIIVKKTEHSCYIISEYLRYARDIRIISDQPNVMGRDNLPEFIDNRHDQTVWSLLCKKHGIKSFRDPSEFGLDFSIYPQDVIERSTYPQVIESHRNPEITNVFQLQYKKWYKYLDIYYYRRMVAKILHRM